MNCNWYVHTTQCSLGSSVKIICNLIILILPMEIVAEALPNKKINNNNNKYKSLTMNIYKFN